MLPSFLLPLLAAKAVFGQLQSNDGLEALFGPALQMKLNFSILPGIIGLKTSSKYGPNISLHPTLELSSLRLLLMFKTSYVSCTNEKGAMLMALGQNRDQE